MKPTTPSPATRRLFSLIAAAFVIVSALTFPVREPLYEALAGAAFDNSDLHGLVDLVASKGLLALVAITVLVAVVAWRRGLESFVLLVSAGFGTITAYAASEVVKLLIEQQRPCRELAAETIMACPGPTDWSWPSNHATIAAALATSCVLVLPRIWPLLAPIALLIGLSRVFAGVHYPHDVAAGFALGIALTLIVTVNVNRPLIRILTALRQPVGTDHRRRHR